MESPLSSNHSTRGMKKLRGVWNVNNQPTIHVIAGGPTLTGDLNRARKNYGRYVMTSKEVLLNLPAANKAKVRQVPIMWTEDNEEGILYPHEDALVIKALVAGTELR